MLDVRKIFVKQHAHSYSKRHLQISNACFAQLKISEKCGILTRDTGSGFRWHTGASKNQGRRGLRYNLFFFHSVRQVFKFHLNALIITQSHQSQSTDRPKTNPDAADYRKADGNIQHPQETSDTAPHRRTGDRDPSE